MSDEFDEDFDEFKYDFDVRPVPLSPAKLQDSLEELERDVAEIREWIEGIKTVLAAHNETFTIVCEGIRDHKASGHHVSWPWVIAALIAAAVWFSSR